MKHFIILLLLMFFGFTVFALGDAETDELSLFKIGRSKDANEIHYEVNLDENGNLDLSSPFRTYWIKYTWNGRIEPLTWIQTRYAYGLKILHRSPKNIEFQFVSYSKRNFWLKRLDSGRYKVFTLSNGKEVEVERVFIQIDGGTFWVPKISQVELFAKQPETGDAILEIIHP
jgi:hypothetical protein